MCFVASFSVNLLAWIGSGTQSDPYQIRNKAELNLLTDSVNNSAPAPAKNWSYDKYFKLMNDITIPVTTKIGITISRSFQGHFDGNSNTIILNIAASNNNYVGLFGTIDSASIRNVTVIGSVQGNYYVGGVVGYACRYSAILNCINTANVEGNYYVGGIIGEINSSTASNSMNIGIIKGNDGVGGIIGYASESFISNGINYGYVKGNSAVGGVVGYDATSHSGATNTIFNCVNTGVAEGTGGIVGAEQ